MAADFAFGNGAFEFLVLPQLSVDGLPQISADALAQAEIWMKQNHRRCRIACSARGAELLDLPVLPISDPYHADREFLHIDANGFLRLSAFSGSGVRISDFHTLMHAIAGLRSKMHENSLEAT